VRVRRALVWVGAVALLPFAGLGLVTLAMQLYGLVRFEPSYFGPATVERYALPNAAVRSLEQALRTGDAALLAELQGLRWPLKLPAGPDIAFVMLWDRNGPCTRYLYLDRRTYERSLYCFESVNGRWVVAPPDLFLAMHTGGWQPAFLRAAGVWWTAGVAGVGLVWVCRRSARVRAWLLGS
jgi:hypothetical protein